MGKTNNLSIPYLRKMKPYAKSGEPVKMLTDEEFSRQKKDRIKSWVTFYRQNPSYFVEHYMGVELYAYQRFMLNLMARCTNFIAIASRASAKSWLIGIYSIARCILYPGTNIVLASSTKAQAGLIIADKCKALRDEHPNIAREISSLVTNNNKWEINFHNGSWVKVVVSGEAGRGNRSTVTVLEERRLISTETVNAVLRPFLVSRQPPYMKKLEYATIPELREEPQEVIITSAYYKSYEWYPETKRFLKKLAAGNKDIKVIFLDYPITIRHGIKTKKQIENDRTDFDAISFLMEYGNIPYGSSSKSFYKLGLFKRDIKRSWRPITDEVFITKGKNKYDIPKMSDEIRVVSADIAMRAGSTNDNTIITCARLFPTRKGWKTEIVYLESHNGKNTELQTLRIKQIFEEFEANALVLDIANAGIGIYDTLSSVTKDETRGVEYPGYTVMNWGYVDDALYKELDERTLSKDAKECIFPIYGTSTLNSQIAIEFRKRLKDKLVTFLVDDNTEEEFLIKSGNKDILSQDDSTIRAYLLHPHLQTSLLINECISLEMATTGAAGLIKLVEPEGGRKDRFSSVSYLNYYVSLLDMEFLKENYTEKDDEEIFLGVSVVM